MTEEPGFRDFTADVDALLADPTVADQVEQQLEEMHEADRAHAMGLAALRRAADLTQQEIARSLGITQGAVARAEKRQDMLLSTLNAYVEAIGGTLRVLVTFDNGRQVAVDLADLGAHAPGTDPPEDGAAAA